MFTSTPTLSELSAQLAVRLDDVDGVHFLATERTSYIQEAIRFFNSASLYFRERGTLATVAGTPFYDLSDATTGLTTGSEFLLQKTLKDRDLVNDIERSLIEPVTSNWALDWAGTEQFTLDAIVKSLQRRRDQFLEETGLVTTVSEIDVPSAPIGRIPLSDGVMNIRRAAWLSYDSDGNPDRYTNLWKTDEAGLNSYLVDWSLAAESPRRPKAYSSILTPHVQIQIAPVPQDIGKIHLVTVDKGATLDTEIGVLLGVPDDFAWALKYGAMADLLGQDGQGRDSFRAGYCEQRFREGIELGKIFVSVMNVEINGRPKPVSSLFDFDSRNPTWQSAKTSTRGTPKLVARVSHNHIALSLTPDDVYSVTCDVVRNAVVPVADDDVVQIGFEYLPTILDLAEHIAMFKEGGKEFEATMPQFERAMKACAEMNGRLKQNARNFSALVDKKERAVA